MFTPKNRDRLPEVVRDEVDNIQAQISTTFLKEHDNQGRHVFPAGDVVPTGAMLLWPSDTAPNSKWLFCRGQQVSRTTYTALFQIFGTTYGAGDGSTTFNLPDLQQRFPLGKAAAGTGSSLGNTGGAIDHTHTGPSHTHSISTEADHSHTVGSHTHDFTTDSGGSHVHAMTALQSHATGTAGGLGVTAGTDFDASVAGHAHFADAPGSSVPDTDSGGSHTHTGTTDASASAPSGDAGGHSHGGATGSSGTGNTGTANPPYVVVNYIIFSGVEVN
jgi:microcystin-dependent protein